MLEGVVANLLNRFLGIYVKNFDAKQLNIGIWSGDVKLRNLELRREALDQLRLPLNVVEGHLGELTLSIPWSNLRGKPVKVDIEDVFLLAAPKEDADYDPEEEERRAHALKMERIESAEILKEKNSEGMSQEEQRRNQSFTQSMVTAVVDNLQISIKNVHFRYEDSVASPGHPFAVGVTLKELSAVSTDSDWKPTFIQSTSGTTHKLATLGALSVYWDTDADLLGTGRGSDIGAEAQGISRGELMDRLRSGIDNDGNKQFMLRPVSGRAGLEMDKSGLYDRPAMKTRLLFDELSFVLDDDQYRDALMLVDLFHYFIRHQEYKKFQPKSTPKEDPRAWFRFAGKAVLSKIHDRNRRWSWDFMKERRDDRIAYINLFKKKKREEILSPEEAEDLARLERKLNYEDIRFWRSLARNQLRKENVGVKKPAQQQTWSEWIWGTKKEESEETAITEEQRQELYNAIDWDEKKAISESVDVPREWVKLQVNSALKAGSFTLKRDPHGKSNEVMKLVFDNFQAKALQRPDSFFVDVGLGGLRVYDGTTEGSLFPQIVKVKDSSETDNRLTEVSDIDDLATEKIEESAEDENSLFHFQLEKNPLESDADSVVKVRMKSIEVIYNPRFLVEIVKFFEPPERHMESIGALLDTAGATVEEIRQQTRAGLEFALEEHKKVDAQFDIHAPLFIVPESITQESSLCLILDAGHISVNSELVDRQTMKDIQAKQKRQYDEGDYKELEHLMYDRFLIKLDSTQVLIGPGIDTTKSQLSSGVTSKNMHIIDRINVDFVLEMCIVPKVTELTRTRISGHLPELHASMSDTKYKGLMKLIDIAIPQFDDGNREPDNTTNLKPEETIVSGRARSSSFQPPGLRELPVVDEDSDDESSGEETRKSIDKPANIHRRDFEFKFTVGRLRGSLFRSDANDQQNDHLLVELVAEGFELDFYMRPFDMVAEVVLKSLSVDDYIEENPVPEFKRIISSKGFNADEDKDLFQLKFVRVKPESPEFESTYEGVAMNLDISVSTINLVVTRKTLLTLLDFILLTFTSPQQPNDQTPQSDRTIQDTTNVEEQPQQGGKIRIKADLKSIALILNNDGVRLATLSLNTADVGIFLVGRSMLIQSRIGSLTLVDDVNVGAPETSDLRRLLTIEGDNFADFKYETFDPEGPNYPGYDSEVFLRSGSIKINFLEEPYRKIMNFLVKFGKMQAIFNAARQAAANQATNLQENASRMRFDVVVKTPILVFPRAMKDDGDRDTITAHLGEIYANNRFVPLDDENENSPAVNLISTGIRNIRLTSKFHFEGGLVEELEMIQKVNLDFIICYLEHQEDNPRPDMEIEGNMSPINLRVSQNQLKFLLELSKTVPGAFATDTEQQELEAMEALPSSVTEPTKEGNSKGVKAGDVSQEVDASKETWVRLDMVFKVDSVGLELILAKDNEPIGNLEDSSLSKFSLNDTRVKLRMLTDGSLDSELLIYSLSIRDSRSKDTNKFRKIMSLINNDVQQQFMASLSMSPNKHLIAMLTIDSPCIILALDYLSALQSFSNSVFASDEPEVEEEEDGDESPDESEPRTSAAESTNKAAASSPSGDAPAPAGQMTVSFRVDLVDAQIITIANPAITNTEAIVLGTKQVLFSHQNVSTLQINKVGMFLCRMDKFETSRLRILDDFTLEMSMDSRPQEKGSSLTSINVHIDPLVLRLSLRDILMAIQIVNKASEMTARASQEVETGEAKKLSDGKGGSARSRRRSIGKSTSTAAPKTNQGLNESNSGQRPQRSAVLKREELTAQIDGVRVILIGDLHDLPLLDWSVKKFNVDVRDWSSTLNADTNFDTFVNVYNFSKSAWEPLIEPWQLGFHMAKEVNPEILSIDAYSHKTMELSVTSATIALASKSFQFLSTDEDVLSKPRGADAPYRIRNYTGFDLRVWADVSPEEDGPAAKLTDGEEYPWRFEDSTAMRETLAPEGHGGSVGVKLEGSGFESVNRIPVVREGEILYNLKPKQDGILHRLLVDVKLGADNVKYITFRSPLVIENNTQIPVELGIFNPEEGHLLKIEKILPGDARPAPVGAAYMHSVVIRPDQGFGYDWSNEQLFWKDLMRRPTRTIKCLSEGGQQAPPFYFQMNATFNPKDSLTKVYPYMKIRIFAPVEIQNLLPYDFKYRIYDKNTKKDWTNFLRKGGISPVHVVELSHLLLLSIDLEDTVFRQSDFAIINGNAQDFRREHVLSLKDERGIQLKLRLHYFNVPDSGGAFKVSIYSPYLILNKTGLAMEIQSKAFLQSARSAAGQGLRADSRHGGRTLPYMYSYPTDDQKNRSMLKIGESAWSKPQSFEAIGSTFEVMLPDRFGRSEFHSGVSVAEGEGKYKMTKVVTISPRFVLKNKLSEDLLVREPGSSNVLNISSGELAPLHFLRQVAEKQLCLCFPGVNNQWSSPFNIADVGTVHVKLAKANQRQKLVKVDIVMEDATLFIHFNIETRNWPYSMRNESDTEFIFYQANPNVEDDEDDRTSGWRPIRYRLPPRSIMPYAWDYPATKNKSLVLTCNGKERHVKLAEIGNLIPMRIPPTQHGDSQRIIDINIVANGPTQTLVLSNFKPSKSLYRQQRGQSSQASLSTGFEVKEMNSDVNFKAQLRLGGVGISLINQNLKELLYLTFREIEVKFRESRVYQTLNTTIKWIQIDNQLYGGIFPILLYPSVVPKTGKEMEAHPIFHAMVTRVKDDSYGVLYIKYATVLLQQMTLELDEDFILAMLDFAKIPGASWSEEQEGRLCDEDLNIPEPQQEGTGQDVYFELLHLQPMQVDISFMRTERVNVEDTMQPSNPFMFIVNVMTMSMGNINDAPVRLNALMLENARVSFGVLVNNITRHYTQEFLRQVHIVLGSADFLGNPVGLFNNVSSGVAAIFYEPYQGLVMTDRPQELGYGIAKGATSFVKKSVFGFSDSMAKLTGSMSKGLAAATLDKEFQNQRRMSKSRNRPKHALYGITAGGNAFASSLASGIGGLARHPLQGAEKEGLQGFFKGVGKGVLGLATKPAIGAFDLASNLAEGVRNTTTVFDSEGLDRVRLTRFIGTDGIVRPYSQREALGQFWLKTTDNGRYFNEDYIAHLELPGRDMLVLLTYNQIMLVRTKKLETEWDIRLTDIQTISKERTGMSITLKGGANGPFIPVQDESSRNWVYRQIAVAVNAFNEKYNNTRA
ncbi:hypothetical protein ASPWEDRAFT_220427 [Aspergillus wentii DTO 134E9]|uniref:Vacuolar protein sorting-associated protein n=1 Tax=Aspergillus wentii DTO 134E9 TaxID=1073089 RepID=A0A1L9S091_ASPWE|nr:uncharacterized protein ASPWEDRAFT_220427 [Aspergillus wentii DTO 134E9]OJJ40573.1 hypothetical protein ASPWEDRAFT_220427 [Aspergillus wentii DTO 134E9]